MNSSLVKRISVYKLTLYTLEEVWQAPSIRGDANEAKVLSEGKGAVLASVIETQDIK